MGQLANIHGIGGWAFLRGTKGTPTSKARCDDFRPRESRTADPIEYGVRHQKLHVRFDTRRAPFVRQEWPAPCAVPPRRFCEWSRIILCPLVVVFMAVSGCNPAAPSSDGFEPINETQVVFWDRQTTETAKLLEKITAEFNASNDGMAVAIETTGNYGEIYRKVMASIQARRLPAMAVSYESMTAQYAASGAVVGLDALVADPERGISSADLEDFFPAVLGSNYYADYDGQLLSFPFSKSVLMLYANHRVLKEAGIDGPPKTWDEFLEQCRSIKAKTGKFAYAISVDCSTISGMIFSMGGELIVDGQFQYDQPAAIQAFTLLETLINEDLAYQIQARTYDDEVAFARDDVAFTTRTSAGSANMALAMGGKNDSWSLNPIPQSDPAHPATILFGPNITLFTTGAAQEQVAWDFVRHFTSTPVMTEWVLATGYLPIRKSVANDGRIQAYWAAWPSNRAPYDCLETARTEPNLLRWQEIRSSVERAESAVLAKLKTGKEAALELQQEAQGLLDRTK